MHSRYNFHVIFFFAWFSCFNIVNNPPVIILDKPKQVEYWDTSIFTRGYKQMECFQEWMNGTINLSNRSISLAVPKKSKYFQAILFFHPAIL